MAELPEDLAGKLSLLFIDRGFDGVGIAAGRQSRNERHGEFRLLLVNYCLPVEAVSVVEQFQERRDTRAIEDRISWLTGIDEQSPCLEELCSIDQQPVLLPIVL